MSDELVWHRRSPGEDNWRAPSAAEDATYVACLMPSFGTTRILGMLVHDNQSVTTDDIYTSILGMGSLAEAKDTCQEHHNAACRAKRWHDYMLTHEPPTLTSNIELAVRELHRRLTPKSDYCTCDQLWPCQTLIALGLETS